MKITKILAQAICPFIFGFGLAAVVIYILVKVNNGNIGLIFLLAGLPATLLGILGTAYSQNWNKERTLAVLFFQSL